MDLKSTIEHSSLFQAKDLVCVITGGGSGIGLAMATALYRTGAKKVYILGRREDVLSKAAKGINGEGESRVVPLQADVSDPKSIAAAVQIVQKDVGYVDVLVNNAGVSGPDNTPLYKANTIEELQGILLKEPEGWARTFAINSTAVMGVSAAFLHLLDAANTRRGYESGKSEPGKEARAHKSPEGLDSDDLRTAQIITVSSIAAFNRHITAGVPYCASKAAAVAIGKSMANFLSPWNIRSNLICPGLFPSEMTPHIKSQYPVTEIPAQRPGHYNEITGTLLYMVGKAGSYLNGAVQVVDGGRLSVMPATF